MIGWVYAFIIAAAVIVTFVQRVRSRDGALSCPTCGVKARLQEPYWMCDGCESFVGVSINGTNFVSR